jgi:hypothetical protein
LHRYTEAEQCVLELPTRPAAAQVDPTARKRSREALATALNKIRRLEASAQVGLCTLHSVSSIQLTHP